MAQTSGLRDGTPSMAQTPFICIARARSGENHGILVVGKFPAIFLCCTVICHAKLGTLAFTVQSSFNVLSTIAVHVFKSLEYILKGCSYITSSFSH